MRIRFLPIAVFIVVAGCKVGPNYKRPDVAAPPQFRSAQPQATPTASLGDEKWFNIFQDEVLQGLIKEGLQANYDIRIAAQRVLAAEGQFEATRSGLFPQINVQGSANKQGASGRGLSTVGGFGQMAWEVDLFGRLRRATEASRAELLATEDVQKAVLQALIAQVATAYFDLRAYDLEMTYVQESLKTRAESVRLVSARLEGGVSSKLDLDQAQGLVESASADLTRLQKNAEQTENLICFLIGRPPGPIVRGKTLPDQPQPAAIPAGLPSALLERRPDIREAEQQLVAANARVGVAKAAFFPSIALTGGGGYQSVQLQNLFSASGWTYNYGGLIDIPIFDAGRRMGNYKTAKAQREALVVNYQKAISNAFREVSDSLVGYEKNKQFRDQQERYANTLRDQSRLANLRYTGGVSSYLEVLDTERYRLQAEQQLAAAERDELVSLVQLYKALGGGWQ
jgi:outer membrane protein, multidrug efflux system